jgi:hypothetical protein
MQSTAVLALVQTRGMQELLRCRHREQTRQKQRPHSQQIDSCGDTWASASTATERDILCLISHHRYSEAPGAATGATVQFSAASAHFGGW